MVGERPRGRAAGVVGLLGIVAVGIAEVRNVLPTNFGGWDEWLVISLAAKRVLAIPYANRPFVHLFAMPAALVEPHRLESYYLVYAFYVVSIGCLLFLLLRRLVPGEPTIALLAGLFAATFAPSDFLRLDTVLMTGYAGFTFATLLAILMLAEGCVRGSWTLTLGASALGFVTARGVEAVLPLLLAAPGLLYFTPLIPREALRRAAFAWEATLLLAGGLAAWPLLWPGAGPTYQSSALHLDPTPSGVLLRLVEQLGFFLRPLLQSWSDVAAARAAVGVSVAVFVVAFFLYERSQPQRDGTDAARAPALALAGAVSALLGFSVLILSPAIRTPARMQFLSGPGMALVLAAAVAMAARSLPVKTRRFTILVLGSLVIGVGAARTVRMQQEWNAASYWPAQSGLLRALTRVAPRLKPGTLLVLVGASDTFPANFTFRHAVDLLYEGTAVGIAYDSRDFLYPWRFTPEGVVCEPWPVIRRAWREAPTLHRYDEIVVVAAGADGMVDMLSAWPGSLPPLPPGARYQPFDRVLRDGTPPRSRRLLE